MAYIDQVRQIRSTRGVPDDVIAKDIDAILDKGYVVIPNLLSREQVENIKSELLPLLEKFGMPGDNEFHNRTTLHMHNPLNHTLVGTQLIEHPRLLSVMDQFLPRNYLLSDIQPISIGPGSEDQPLHADADIYPFYRRENMSEISLSLMWSLTEFTAQNGATRFMPGSNRWKSDEIEEKLKITKPEYAEMPPGSLVIWLGSTFHGGSMNKTDKIRVGVLHLFCHPYIRQVENFSLSTHRDVVKKCSPVVQGLLGYSIVPPLLGKVSGKSPMKLLEQTN